MKIYILEATDWDTGRWEISSVHQTLDSAQRRGAADAKTIPNWNSVQWVTRKGIIEAQHHYLDEHGLNNFPEMRISGHEIEQ